MRLKQILTISNATTPALVTGQLNEDATYGTTGWGYGRGKPVIKIQAVRANGAAITAVVFQVQGSWTPATDWFIVPCRLSSAVTDLDTLAATQSLSVANNSTADDELVAPDLDGVPYVRVLAQAVTADATANCSAGAWVWALPGRSGTVSP